MLVQYASGRGFVEEGPIAKSWVAECLFGSVVNGVYEVISKILKHYSLN